MRCHFSRHGVISSVRHKKFLFLQVYYTEIEPILPLNHVFSFTANPGDSISSENTDVQNERAVFASVPEGD